MSDTLKFICQLQILFAWVNNFQNDVTRLTYSVQGDWEFGAVPNDLSNLLELRFLLQEWTRSLCAQYLCVCYLHEVCYFSHADFLERCERRVWMLLGLVDYKISQIKIPLNWLKLTFWILGILHNSRSGSAGLYCSSSWAIGLHLPWNPFLCEFIWIYGNELYRHICAWMEIQLQGNSRPQRA